jgi:cobalamin synthase
MGRRSLVWGTVPIGIALIVVQSPRGWIAWAVVASVTAAFGFYCGRRIAGITGDTLGANLQLCECAALLTFVWIRSPQ